MAPLYRARRRSKAERSSHDPDPKLSHPDALPRRRARRHGRRGDLVRPRHVAGPPGRAGRSRRPARRGLDRLTARGGRQRHPHRPRRPRAPLLDRLRRRGGLVRPRAPHVAEALSARRHRRRRSARRLDRPARPRLGTVPGALLRPGVQPLASAPGRSHDPRLRRLDRPRADRLGRRLLRRRLQRRLGLQPEHEPLAAPGAFAARRQPAPARRLDGPRADRPRRRPQPRHRQAVAGPARPRGRLRPCDQPLAADRAAPGRRRRRERRLGRARADRRRGLVLRRPELLPQRVRRTTRRRTAGGGSPRCRSHGRAHRRSGTGTSCSSCGASPAPNRPAARDALLRPAHEPLARPAEGRGSRPASDRPRTWIPGGLAVWGATPTATWGKSRPAGALFVPKAAS